MNAQVLPGPPGRRARAPREEAAGEATHSAGGTVRVSDGEDENPECPSPHKKQCGPNICLLCHQSVLSLYAKKVPEIKSK